MGQSLQKADFVRRLKDREPLATMSFNLLGADICVLPQNDIRMGRFSQKLVRHANDGYFDHLRNFCDDVLDFASADAVATRFDHVALALDEKDEAIFIDTSQIARMEFSVPEE